MDGWVLYFCICIYACSLHYCTKFVPPKGLSELQDIFDGLFRLQALRPALETGGEGVPVLSCPTTPSDAQTTCQELSTRRPQGMRTRSVVRRRRVTSGEYPSTMTLPSRPSISETRDGPVSQVTDVGALHHPETGVCFVFHIWTCNGERLNQRQALCLRQADSMPSPQADSLHSMNICSTNADNVDKDTCRKSTLTSEIKIGDRFHERSSCVTRAGHVHRQQKFKAAPLSAEHVADLLQP